MVGFEPTIDPVLKPVSQGLLGQFLQGLLLYTVTVFIIHGPKSYTADTAAFSFIMSFTWLSARGSLKTGKEVPYSILGSNTH